jgi:SM-20-related protein
MSQYQNHFETIANGLAESGYAIVDDFLDEAEVNAILALDLFAEGTLRKAGIGKATKHVNEGIRGDSIRWIDKETAPLPLQSLLGRLDSLRLSLNQHLFLSLKDYEGHLASYPVGSFYKRHLDQFKSDSHRKISVIVYLNEQWQENEGGQLRMFLKEGHVDIFPMAGRLVCFRSDLIEHEVLPTQRIRRSITGWLLDRLAGDF